MQYRLCTYDIWGNAKEGYNVNGVFSTDVIIEIDDHTSDKAINRRLTRAGCVNTAGTTWDGEHPYTLYGSRKRDGKPSAELRPVKPEYPEYAGI